MINYNKYLKEERTVADAIRDAESKEEIKDLKKAEKVVGDDAVAVDVFSDDGGQIEKALNNSLRRALVMKRNGAEKGFPNVLLIGEAGTGKTERVKGWARKHNINVLEKNATDLDELDLGGVVSANSEAKKANRLPLGEFDELDEVQNSILFLDELNRAPSTVVGTMLKLIDEHTITDETIHGGKKFLKNFLFTVAAINPADENYDTNKLDYATKDRFKAIPIQIELKQFKGFINHKLNKELVLAKKYEDAEEVKANEGRIKIINTILEDSQFSFDSKADIRKISPDDYRNPLNPRTLDYIIMNCDGTKEGFLEEFKERCASPEKYELMETILANYKDIDDKANDALKDEVVFKKSSPKSAKDDLKDFLDRHRVK